jgi:hypothetical protein
VLKDLARWVRRSTKERANGKQSSPRREDYSPGRRKGLHRLAQIRTFAISQREEFSLFTSKFESDMPSHGVGLSGVISDPARGSYDRLYARATSRIIKRRGRILGSIVTSLLPAPGTTTLCPSMPNCTWCRSSG